MEDDIRKGLLKANLLNFPEKDIGIELKKLSGGLSNSNYLAIIKSLSTNEILLKVIYRLFGLFSKAENLELEAKIMSYLAEKGIGPKLYYEDPNHKFRITEYLEGCFHIETTRLLDPMILNKLFPIFESYNHISYSYRYVIKDDKISITKIDDGDKTERIEISKNMFEICTVKWMKKGKENYAKFSEQFLKKYSKEKNPKEFKDFEFFTHYVDNFNKYYIETYPTEGIFVLNHNDTVRLNFLYREKDQKIFLFDNEFASLNNIGNDLVHYLYNTFFTYEPTYCASLDKINLDKIYSIYKEYISQFIDSHKFIEKEEGGKELIKKISTKRYFIMLTNRINLFSFIWSVCAVDFPTWDKDHDEFHFVHGVDRLNAYLIGMKAVENCNE